MKKAIAALMVFSMLMPVVSCSQKPKYSLVNFKLIDKETSWSVPEEKYKTVLESYGGYKCTGTYVVATDKDIIYLYCEDAKEKDGTTRVSQDTVFDIGSCSKTFTAVCILQLMEKGKLSLEDTLDKYFPEYEKGKKITISNLLHMNSGIPDYLNNPDPFWNISGADAANKKISDILQDRTTDEELLKAMYQAPLDFETGTEYGYSNTNYRLLAFIIEKISGMKYCDYVKKNIFDKCGMKKTTSMATGDLTYVPEDYEDQVKYGFSDKDGYPACPNNSRGDGGIHSNLTDMVAFDRALFGGNLLNQKSMEILLKEENGYCCGLIKEKTGYSHSGSSISCSANNKIIESEEFGHIYIIRLEHKGMLSMSDSDDPMSGTNYTKGVFKDGVYTNEYAGLKFSVPKGLAPLTEKEMAQEKNWFLMDITDAKERKRQESCAYDAAFWDGATVIEFTFLNTKRGVPDDPDYTEEEYMVDYIKLLSVLNEAQGGKVVRKGTEKVMIGGKEYLRVHLVYEYSDGNTESYLYMRKLDENLIVCFDIGGVLKMPIADYEKFFE